MGMKSELKEYLTNSATTAAFGGKIAWVRAKQDVVPPHLVLSVVDTDRIMVHDGYTGLTFYEVEADVYSGDAAGAQINSDNLLIAMEAWEANNSKVQGVQLLDSDDWFDEGRMLFCMNSVFKIAYKED